MWLSRLRAFTRQLDSGRVVEVGWLLRTDHAGFVWQDPRPARSREQSNHAKSVSFCPAVVDHEARLFQVPCPFDLRLRVQIDDKGAPTLVDIDGDRSSVVARTLSQICLLSPRNQWRHPDRAIMQIKTPYTFVADEPVYMMQLPPLLSYRSPPWPGLVIGGRMPIHIWPRPLAWAFEWHDLKQDLVLRRGEPWFCCRFETEDACRHVRLVEAELTPEVKQYLAGIIGVVNYVHGSFGLFDTARRRRPERLLVKAPRRRFEMDAHRQAAGGDDKAR